MSNAEFSFVKIKPFQAKPPQDLLIVSNEPSAKIQWSLCKLIPGKPAIAAVPGVVGRGQILESGTPGMPGYQPYVPAIEGRPEIPGVAAVADEYLAIEQGVTEMDDAEWEAWKDRDDHDYRVSVVIKRLGLSPES